MFRVQGVLTVMALSIGAAHSWDFVVSIGDQLIFYTDQGTKTNTVHLESRNPGSLAYDEVHNIVLYVDKQNNNDAICEYNLSSKENNCFRDKQGRNIHSIAYDPATEKLFFTDTNEKTINWISCKNGCKSNSFINLLIDTGYRIPTDIAVDSCSGYIYWFSKGFLKVIERARFDGSDRESLNYDVVSSESCYSLTVDPKTKKMYYFGDLFNKMWSADLNSKHKDIIHGRLSKAQDFTVSKDYFYWTSSSRNYKSVWLLPKNAGYDENPKEKRFYTDKPLGIAANYKIVDITKGNKDCKSLLKLIPALTAAPHNTGKQSDVPVCANYCLQGNCRVNDKGLPTCSCYAGFSGKRCEVSTCHGYCQNDGICSLNKINMPVCKCKAGFKGERCQITDCVNYCIEGQCIFIDKGYLTCRCNAGYTGKRCEVSVCHGYCQNDGICSLNAIDMPVCECKAGFVGDRCEITDCLNYCIQGKCIYNNSVLIDNYVLFHEGYPTCSCNAGYTGKRCEISACHDYCLNDGTCSLNNNNKPVCQCKAGYVGERCEISDCLNYCIQGNCSFSNNGQRTCSCNAGYTGKRCEVSVCHGYCQNNGTCSLNINSKPVCQCKAGYVGDRCEITDCVNYCIQGKCSFNEEGHPTCSCNVGYTGDRCEVSSCHGYCLNNGECSLSEEDEPVCQCVGNQDGLRCEVDIPVSSN